MIFPLPVLRSDSVSPNAGTGGGEVFTAVFSGQAGLTSAQILTSTGISDNDKANGCWVHLDRVGTAMWLYGDSYWWGPVAMGSPATLENYKCAVYTRGASVSVQGDNVVFKVPVGFKAPIINLGGAQKNVYLSRDQTTFTDAGDWTVNNISAPLVIWPFDGAGSLQKFTVIANNVYGWEYMTWLQFRIGDSLSDERCKVHLNRFPNPELYLWDPTPAFWRGPVLVGSAATLENNWCKLYAGEASLSGLSAALTWKLQLEFKVAFSGPSPKRTYIRAKDYWGGDDPSWRERGLFQVTTGADLLTSVRECLAGTSPECIVPAGVWEVSTPLAIGRSVILRGATSGREGTQLVRAHGNTAPIIKVDHSSPLSSVTVRDLTICGNSNRFSPVPSPSFQCTRPPAMTVCGQRTEYGNGDICTDFEVSHVATGQYGIPNPNDPNAYALRIENVLLEGATGHALSLYSHAGMGKRVNDVLVKNSAVNYSEVTGILYGTSLFDFHPWICDNNPFYPDFPNHPYIIAPRNIRVQDSVFEGNHTGAMGCGAVRWLAVHNNIFRYNNSSPPPVSAKVGGSICTESCSDPVTITNNQFFAPPGWPRTSGMELYSRNLTIQGNTLSGFGYEGIQLVGVFNASVTGNTITGSGSYATGAGGIGVATSETTTGECGDPRDTQIVTITQNTVNGSFPAWGVHFPRRDRSRNIVNVRVGQSGHISGNTLNITGRQVNKEIGQDVGVEVLPGGSVSPSPEDARPRDDFPRVMTVTGTSSPPHRCFMLSGAKVFTFPASHDWGSSNLKQIEVHFTELAGRAGDGVPGCRFTYDYSANEVELTWDDGTPGKDRSVLGAGGHTLQNSYCKIYAAESTTALEERYIINLNLKIEFIPGSSYSTKYIHTIATDTANRPSEEGQFKYWGWVQIPPAP